MNKGTRAVKKEEPMDKSMGDDSTPEQSPVSGNVRKRKRQDPSELCQAIYDSIRNTKKEDGSMLCDTFIRAPKRRQEPSYYEVVSNPIDLLRVQQKLKTESYDDVDELTTDFDLLIKNAKAFYKPGTPEYQDACLLWATFNANKAKLIEANGDDDSSAKLKKIGRQRKSAATNDGDDASETSSLKADDDAELFEELFASVMTACDDNNRPLHPMFLFLPSKKLYSDYYDIIDHPIDLKFIATKIQTSAYTSLNEMEKDLLQMTKNACTFNEPGSQIYKDAKTLKRIFTTKKLELESGKTKISTKPRRKGQSLSATTAAMKEPVDESDDDNDEHMDTDGDDGPMWQLFDQLYNTANVSDTANASGAPLGESLWKLPNRRFNPEYYSQIKKPISMSQVRKKLKKGDYVNITDMTADLYLMLDNAKKAFPATHKTHKDALKMQKILNQRLIDDDQDESEDDLPLIAFDSKSLISVKSQKDDSDLEDDLPLIGTPLNSNKAKRRPPRLLVPAGATTAQTVVPPSPTALTSAGGSPKSRFPTNPILKKKLLGLQKFLCEYTVAGRRPMTLFMEKPSKKLYPDYYEVIQHPIDMTTIEQSIKNDRYGTLDDVVGDFRLMFLNCRKYNEEGSLIYEDSNLLERALNEKLKEFSGLNDRRLTPKVANPRRKVLTPMDNKLKLLYEAIRDFREPKAQRQLALIFMKLPSKNDYPDYYDIIKNPIDMEKIAHKLKTHYYDNVDEIATDFMLMFENACKYNEPDSQIYKDALVLQQVCIQTKQVLREGDDTVPDVPQAVQELLLSLFTTFYNHQDEEGRCFSDSLAELPEYDDIDGQRVRGISLDLIKRRLDKLLYKRLDTFQEDVFLCLERARKLSRTDSQIFEDAIELQAFFIRKRDELCKGVLTSQALSYTVLHLNAAVETDRQARVVKEEQELDHENDISAQGESMTIDQKVYSPGDFVYYNVPENKIPGVIYIERLWTTSEGVKMMNGTAFLRPFETFHVTTRKFLEQELFRGEQHIAVPLSQIGGKCFVMSAKEYFKMKPEEFADRDIYVCESRYFHKLRTFKKIKTWPFGNSTTKLVMRDPPLEPKRVMSVFKERIEKHKGELAELQEQEALVEKEKPNVLLHVNNGDVDLTYYEQYNTICSGVVKVGDYVYVATDTGKQSIAQIHSIWETRDEKSYFRGPWLLTPPEIPGIGNRFFYRQELMLSTVQETNPMVAIVGRCMVMELNEYSITRPTEITESDVFVCESIYDEHKKQVRRNQPGQGLRRFSHSPTVTLDEMMHFKRSIIPAKVSANEIAALQDSNKGGCSTQHVSNDIIDGPELLGFTEDSMDGGPPSFGSDMMNVSSPAPSTVHHSATPMTTKKKDKEGGGRKSKLVTGYILYSSEVRKDRAQSHPECTFGDISRIVGNEWRSLMLSEKQAWEERAKKYNEETQATLAEEAAANNNCPSPAPTSSALNTLLTTEPLPNQIFECLWHKCDWQFEDAADCVDHILGDGTGHVQTHFVGLQGDDAEFNCLWRNCIRLKKSAPSFPHLVRLMKHVREVHINKCGRIVLPADRNKNFVPSKKVVAAPPVHIPVASPVPIPQPVQPTYIVAAPPAEPLFVTVPPRPQRVLHSEAYIKYIEGLQNDTRFITPWEKTLNATQETAPTVDVAKLPTQWLRPAVSKRPDDAVAALWKLRDFMMKDIINAHRY